LGGGSSCGGQKAAANADFLTKRSREKKAAVEDSHFGD
jgi:hypothetical protein